MKRHYHRALPFLVAICIVCACTYQEPRMRAEPLITFPAYNIISLNKRVPLQVPVPAPESTGAAVMPSLDFHCAAWNPVMTRFYDSLTSSLTAGSSSLDECIYVTIDQQNLTAAMNMVRNDPAAQDSIVRSLETASDYNCNNFRARVFGFRSNVGYVGGLASGLLASGGAITALVSGPAAAGLAGASSAVTAAINPINTDYYSNYTMGQLDTLIVQRRSEMKACIEQRMAAAEKNKATPASTPTASEDPSEQPSASQTPSATPTAAPNPSASCPTSSTYSAAQKISDLQFYDSLCSLELLAQSLPSSTPLPSQAQPPSSQATPTSPAQPPSSSNTPTAHRR